MLFNSVEFLFFFLPLTILLFLQIAKRYGNEPAIAVLVACSLFFYGWWNPVYLLLLLASMGFNYLLGGMLGGRSKHKGLLIFGIAVNLSAIAYFKYAGFILNNVNSVFDVDYSIGNIILPLAISFFTFQQIAYLVDSYKGITKEYSFLHYALFVSFFPQLIAGPIVHHKDMLPQFERNKAFQLNANDVAIGLSIFAIGLFKKTVIADGIAIYATPIFSMADAGESIDFFTAWGGALAYTFQLYFDFSGYSDMAVGLARIFGIVLPLNFYSPYKAANISEFWRRWHMTLSKFLRDYVYIALGGNRKGQVSRYTNLLITMLLGGLWHGAGWNFVIWGGLHGSYLIINHSWQHMIKSSGVSFVNSMLYRYLAWFITIIAVIIGWVFFRAVTLDGALNMLSGMAGLNGISMPNAIYVKLSPLHQVLDSLAITPTLGGGAVFVKTWLWIITLTLVVLVLPNIQDMFAKHKATLSTLQFDTTNAIWPAKKIAQQLQFSYSTKFAFLSALAFVLGLLTLNQVSEFLYFQF
ncbi:MBOAT family protein [Thalassotalea sp. PP2-459]|uniref:MBOAT family O-acyltransferase n=1 Tax=Thalassotalea sp. PP2-459 TaxID=1742724 RepID=UPI000943E7D6|nr:MBOAT family protein [Thalassotalea sp. PP2-459]OKY26727.1 membrane-bound O-acyltransferase family protein [Thalassotalea sp. PP2-459]